MYKINQSNNVTLQPGDQLGIAYLNTILPIYRASLTKPFRYSKQLNINTPGIAKFTFKITQNGKEKLLEANIPVEVKIF